MENRVKDILKKLTNKKNIYLVSRGNKAIKEVLKLIDKEVLIQDQGGWLTYKQFPKKFIELKTDYGIIDLEDLKNKAKNKVLLINSLTGYFAEQPMKEIERVCKEKNCLIINDVSGSIGLDIAKIGDIILGSFGEWKIISINYGGFIASDKKYNIEEDFDKNKFNLLYKELKNINERLKFLYDLNKKVKEDLKEFNILHKNKRGINVIVKYKNNLEKEKLIKYCNKNNFQYTLCPRYIRVNCEAISIEIKRIC